KTGPGRLPDLLDLWSARRLKEAGADCVKILLYYTAYDPRDVNDKKHAWVERIGDECRANDIPYFLEFVGYEEGADEKGLEYAKKKPHIVTESMREFSKDRSGVKFNGVLCGRATWKDGIPVYAKQGAAAFRKWLETEGVMNINNVNSKLSAATSWYSIYAAEPALVGA